MKLLLLIQTKNKNYRLHSIYNIRSFSILSRLLSNYACGFQIAQLVKSLVVEQGTWVQIPLTLKTNWCLGLIVRATIMSGRHRFKCYLPSYPPKPEAVIDAITKLHKKLSREIYEDRIRSQQGSRCFTISHKFSIGRSIHTGNYNRGLLYQPPSTSEIPLETFFKYNKNSVSSHELVN